MKTFALPIWNSSCDIFTDFNMCSTPRLASPFQRGHVSWVSSAYLRSNVNSELAFSFGLQINYVGLESTFHLKRNFSKTLLYANPALRTRMFSFSPR